MQCSIVLVFAGLLAFALGAAVKSGGIGVLPHIIGGDNVHFTERLYTIGLKLTNNGEFVRYCGGARLNRQWFVTAAECLDKEKSDEIQIFYGANNPPKYWDSGRFDLNGLKHSIHPEYDEVTKANNIGLFKCVYCLSGDESKLPKISEKDETYSGSTAIVAAWTIANNTDGSQNENKITSYNTQTVSPFICKLAYLFASVNSGHICASSRGGKRLTEDDVGVPLVIKEDKENLNAAKLIGIASSLKPWSSRLPVPIVFTKIASHVKWISSVTGIKVPN